MASQQITNDVPILITDEFAIGHFSPYTIIAGDVFEEADGGKLGWYAPARKRPTRIGSLCFRPSLAPIERALPKQRPIRSVRSAASLNWQRGRQRGHDPSKGSGFADIKQP